MVVLFPDEGRLANLNTIGYFRDQRCHLQADSLLIIIGGRPFSSKCCNHCSKYCNCCSWQKTFGAPLTQRLISLFTQTKKKAISSEAIKSSATALGSQNRKTPEAFTEKTTTATRATTTATTTAGAIRHRVSTKKGRLYLRTWSGQFIWLCLFSSTRWAQNFFELVNFADRNHNFGPFIGLNIRATWYN